MELNKTGQISILAFILTLAVGGGTVGTVVFDPILGNQTMPDSAWYGLEIASENVNNIFFRNKERQLDQINERISEALVMQEQNKTDLSLEAIKRANKKIEKELIDSDDVPKNLSEGINTAILNIDRIRKIDNFPSEADNVLADTETILVAINENRTSDVSELVRDIDSNIKQTQRVIRADSRRNSR